MSGYQFNPHLLQVLKRCDVEPAGHPEPEVEGDRDDGGRGADHFEVVGSDGVEETRPPVTRVSQTVEEYHGGCLLDPRLEYHGLQGGLHHFDRG